MPFRLFLLCPLTPFISSSFVSASFPLPSSSLHAGYSSFSSVLAASLVSSLFFLFVFLAFGFRFHSVCVLGSSLLCDFSCWYFQSRGSPFVPVSLSSLLISRGLLVPLLLLLSSSRLFLIFPIRCLFFLLFFYLVPSSRLCCCASLSGSFFLGFALLRSFLCPHSSSLRLRCGWGGLSPAQCLWYLDIRRWSLLLILSFLCLFLLSSFLVGSFLCLCFYFCLLLGSFLSSLFGASSFCCCSTWFLPLASAAVPLSLRLLLPRLRSPSLIPLSSAFLSSAPLGRGGGLAPALCLCYLGYCRWSLLLIRGFSPWFLLPLLCTSCYRFWLFFSASDCFSAGSPFLFSGFVALGWGSAPVGLSWVGLASGSSAFLLSLSLPPVLHSVLGPLRIL